MPEMPVFSSVLPPGPRSGGVGGRMSAGSSAAAAESPFAVSLARADGGAGNDPAGQAASGTVDDAAHAATTSNRSTATGERERRPVQGATAAEDVGAETVASGAGPDDFGAPDADERSKVDAVGRNGFPWVCLFPAAVDPVAGTDAAAGSAAGMTSTGTAVTAEWAGPFQPAAAANAASGGGQAAGVDAAVVDPAAGGQAAVVDPAVGDDLGYARFRAALDGRADRGFVVAAAPGAGDEAAATPVPAGTGAAVGDPGYERFRAALAGMVNGDAAADTGAKQQTGQTDASTGGAGATDFAAASLRGLFSGRAESSGAADFAGRPAMTPQEMAALLLGANGGTPAAATAADAGAAGAAISSLEDREGSPPARSSVSSSAAAVSDFIAHVRETLSAGRRVDIASIIASVSSPGTPAVANVAAAAVGAVPAAAVGAVPAAAVGAVPAAAVGAVPAENVDAPAPSRGAEVVFRLAAGNPTAAAGGADDGNPGSGTGDGRPPAGQGDGAVSTGGLVTVTADDSDPAADRDVVKAAAVGGNPPLDPAATDGGSRLAAARLPAEPDGESTLRFRDGDAAGHQAASAPAPGQTSGLHSGVTAAAAAGPAALLANTVSSDDILEQVTVRLSRLQPGDGQVRLQLQPAELGRVDVQLTMEGHEMTARFIVQHPEVRELLYKYLDQLRDSLAVKGVEVKQVVVEVVPADRGEGTSLNADRQGGRDAFGSSGHSGGRQDDGGGRGDVPRAVVPDAEPVARRAAGGGAADNHPGGSTETRRRSLDLRI